MLGKIFVVGKYLSKCNESFDFEKNAFLPLASEMLRLDLSTKEKTYNHFVADVSKVVKQSINFERIYHKSFQSS